MSRGRAAGSPAFPPRVHRPGAVVHNCSTSLCTRRRPAVRPPPADQRAGASRPCPARQARGPGADEIAQEAATGGHRRYTGKAGRGSVAACPSRHPDPVRAARRRCARVRRPVTAVPAIPQPHAGTRRADPINHWARRPAEATPVLGRGLGSSPLPLRRLPACRTGATRFLLDRIRQGPSMYEMEGPCPASPHRLASCLALPGPRAAAGARYPCEAPVSRLLPRSRGRPRAVPVSSGGIFLLHPRAPRKGLQGTISGVSAIHIRFHRKLGVIRISPRLSTGLFTVYPQPGDMSRRTPGLLIPDVIG
jgi:hypothetical protein